MWLCKGKLKVKIAHFWLPVVHQAGGFYHQVLICFLFFLQEMQEDQQKQLKDMKENIGYYQKKAQELEVRYSSPEFARYIV